jgi:hypothetical protein
MADAYVELATVEGRHVADIIKSYFEANGIPVELSQESFGVTVGLTIGKFGEVHLLVPTNQIDEARELLQAFYAGEES